MASGDNYGLPERFTSTNVTQVRYVNGEPQCAVYEMATDRCGWWRPEDLELIAAPLRHMRSPLFAGPVLRVRPRKDAVPLAELRSKDLG